MYRRYSDVWYTSLGIVAGDVMAEWDSTELPGKTEEWVWRERRDENGSTSVTINNIRDWVDEISVQWIEVSGNKLTVDVNIDINEDVWTNWSTTQAKVLMQSDITTAIWAKVDGQGFFNKQVALDHSNNSDPIRNGEIYYTYSTVDANSGNS